VDIEGSFGTCISCDITKELYFSDDGDEYCASCYEAKFESGNYQPYGPGADSFGVCDTCGKNREFGNCSC